MVKLFFNTQNECLRFQDYFHIPSPKGSWVKRVLVSKSGCDVASSFQICIDDTMLCQIACQCVAHRMSGAQHKKLRWNSLQGNGNTPLDMKNGCWNNRNSNMFLVSVPDTEPQKNPVVLQGFFNTASLLWWGDDQFTWW